MQAFRAPEGANLQRYEEGIAGITTFKKTDIFRILSGNPYPDLSGKDRKPTVC